jgi:hypothetical protein
MRMPEATALISRSNEKIILSPGRGNEMPVCSLDTRYERSLILSSTVRAIAFLPVFSAQ